MLILRDCIVGLWFIVGITWLFWPQKGDRQ